MKWFRENIINYIVVYLNIVLVIDILKYCLGLGKIDYLHVSVLCFLGILIHYIYCYKIKSIERRLIFTMIVLATVLFISVAFRDVVRGYFIDGIIDNITTMNNNMGKGEILEFSVITPSLNLIIPVVMAILLWISNKAQMELIVLTNICIMALYWYLGYHNEIKINLVKFVFISLLTFGVNSLNSIKSESKKKNIIDEIKKSRLYITIVSIAVAITIVISLLPQDIGGKYTETLDDKVKKAVGSDVSENGNPEKSGYSLLQSGYSDSSKKLGGPISVDSTQAFKVNYSGVSNPPKFYLKGNSKDKYTGYSWESTIGAVQRGDSLSDYERYSVNSVGEKQEEITISPDKIGSTTFFTPNFPISVSKHGNVGNIYVNIERGTFYSEKPSREDYTIRFVNYNQVIDKMSKNLKKENIYNSDSESPYLQLPNSITQRTKDLVYEIVKDSNSDYDKVTKIRDYLSKNYTYSMEVASVPDGADFVDYFLFTEKKGYCVYFASTLTVMCRIAGVRARYIEGFKMSDKKDNDGKYSVTNEDAHAWTEVLLPVINADSSRAVIYQADSAPTAHEFKDSKKDNNDTTANENETTNNATQVKKTSKDIEVDEGSINSSNRESFTLSKNQENIIFLGLALIAYLSAIQLIRFRKKRKVLTDKSIVPFYMYCERKLRSVGIKKDSGNTLLEFSKTIEDREISKKMEQLTNIVYEELYGENKNIDFDKNDMIACIDNYAIKTKGKFNYYMRKYITIYI